MAKPTTTVSRARPAETSAKAAPRPMTSDTPHPAVASLRGLPRILRGRAVAGQEDQEGQAEIRQSGDHAVEVGQIEDVGADQDAQADRMTISGMARRPDSSERIGANTAARAMSTSVPTAAEVILPHPVAVRTSSYIRRPLPSGPEPVGVPAAGGADSSGC